MKKMPVGPRCSGLVFVVLILALHGWVLGAAGASKPFAERAESYPRWLGARSTDLGDPRWEILNQREKSDPGWRGRMEIEFYGKVVDENKAPVEGALVKFSKGDLSAAGTTQLEKYTDVAGLVSLTGVLGRGMSVTAEKPGYYPSVLNRRYFEFAAFSDENFYQPDADHPVLFTLRKKQPAVPLIAREQEVKIGGGVTADVTLDLGIKIQVQLLSNLRPKQGPWAMRVNVVNGGLQATAEEFPFTAPTDGYQATLELDNKGPKPPGWSEMYEGGVLYLKTGKNYGRIEVQMIPGKDWLRIKSWLNPSPDDRILESTTGAQVSSSPPKG